MKPILLTFVLLTSMITVFAQDAMTPERFRSVVAAPGDNTPLISQLASVPFWTNAVVSNTMTYTSGKVLTEQMTLSAHTVGGKYVVFTMDSQVYHGPVNTILTLDEKSSSLKVYGLFPDEEGKDVLTESTVTYNFKKKTFSMNSTYLDFKESVSGSYSDTQSTVKATAYKDGVLVMTRETITRPVGGK